MIKAVIFDLGGVLIDLDMHRCFENVKALGVDMDALIKPSTADSTGQGATICNGVTASGIIHLYQVGKVSTEDLIGYIQKMADPGTTYQQVLDAWNSCLLTIPQYKLDFIKELRGEGYKTYLLSNTNDAHWKYIEDTRFPEPVGEYFDKVFLSQEMGHAKPNEDIYEAVIEQITESANECLFIDDSKVNCEAAEKLGIHTYNTPVRTDFREEVRKLISKLANDVYPRQLMVLSYLREHDIPFDCYNHPEGKTIEEAKRWWRDDGSVHCKNIFMRNHKGNKHYLICFDCDHDLDIHDLEARLKASLQSQGLPSCGKLSFASPERMMKHLGLEPGSVSPFGLINDTDSHVHLFLDANLQNAETLSFHPNDCRGTVVIKKPDFEKYLSIVGNTYEYIELY